MAFRGLWPMWGLVLAPLLIVAVAAAECPMQPAGCQATFDVDPKAEEAEAMSFVLLQTGSERPRHLQAALVETAQGELRKLEASQEVRARHAERARQEGQSHRAHTAKYRKVWDKFQRRMMRHADKMAWKASRHIAQKGATQAVADQGQGDEVVDPPVLELGLPEALASTAPGLAEPSTVALAAAQETAGEAHAQTPGPTPTTEPATTGHARKKHHHGEATTSPILPTAGPKPHSPHRRKKHHGRATTSTILPGGLAAAEPGAAGATSAPTEELKATGSPVEPDTHDRTAGWTVRRALARGNDVEWVADVNTGEGDEAEVRLVHHHDGGLDTWEWNFNHTFTVEETV